MPIASSNAPQIITLLAWNGINASASRGLIDDQECHWLENLFPVATGQLRAGYGPSAPIYSAPPGSIARIFTADITGAPSIFAFKTDGTVDRINTVTQNVHPLGQIWQPVPPQYQCDLKLWQPSQYGFAPGQVGGVVIGSPQGLYAVDGNDVVTGPGALPPLWLTGGATTDSTGAALRMPSGLPGIYALEVYNQRLWVMGQTVVAFSAAGNGADFSTGSGGGAFPYFGDKLTNSRTDLAAGGGFLYLFNDSSIDVIGNVQLIGQGTIFSPFTTAFQLSNVDPQNGEAWFRPVGHWGNAFILANSLAIFGFQGQQAQVISQKIINLYKTLNASTIMPSMCPVDIHGKRWMLLNGVFTDPWGISRSMLLCWDGAVWVAASQHLELTNIVSFTVNSQDWAYGTDGTVIVRLFAQPDPALPKRVSTKAYKGETLLTIKHWKRLYLEMRDALKPAGPEGVSLTGTISTADGGIQNGKLDIGFTLPPGGFGTIPQPTDGAAGISAWVDLLSLSPDFVLERLSLTYDERTLFGA